MENYSGLVNKPIFHISVLMLIELWLKLLLTGLGESGRLALRIGLLKHHNEMEFVAINTSGSMEVEGWCHLLNQDTTYRKFEIEVNSREGKKSQRSH